MPTLTGTLRGWVLLGVQGNGHVPPVRGSDQEGEEAPQARQADILKPSHLADVGLGGCICMFGEDRDYPCRIPIKPGCPSSHLAAPIQSLPLACHVALDKAHYLPGVYPKL